MKTDCEQFGELISGLIDGELSVSETERVTLHLTRCNACRTTQTTFEMVDKAIQSPHGLATLNGDPAPIPLAVKPTPRKKQPQSRNNHLFKRRFWMPVSITTLAMIIVGLTILWPTDEAGAETTNIKLPLLELDKLEQLNRETKKNANTTLRTMELQLRMMRVDAKRLDSANENEAQLQSEIERLLTAVGQLKTN